jgi:hypothetical protein
VLFLGAGLVALHGLLNGKRHCRVCHNLLYHRPLLLSSLRHRLRCMFLNDSCQDGCLLLG